jgi:hypothetical protein
MLNSGDGLLQEVATVKKPRKYRASTVRVCAKNEVIKNTESESTKSMGVWSRALTDWSFS